MRHCNHKNNQFTWQGEKHVLTCVLEKGHDCADQDNCHKGFAPKVGKPVSDPSKYPDEEIVVLQGISYIVEEELVSWGQEEGKELKHPEKEKEN